MPRQLWCLTTLALLFTPTSELAQGWWQPYLEESTYWEYIESGPQINALTSGTELDQIHALAWVRPSAQVGETFAVIAFVVWQYNEEMRPERMAISDELTLLRYSGYDNQGVNIERRRGRGVNSSELPKGATIRSADDCFNDISFRQLAFVVGARRQALQRCSEGWRGWIPAWQPWQLLRLPSASVYTVDVTGSIVLPLKLEVMGSRLSVEPVP